MVFDAMPKKVFSACNVWSQSITHKALGSPLEPGQNTTVPAEGVRGGEAFFSYQPAAGSLGEKTQHLKTRKVEVGGRLLRSRRFH